MVVSEVGVPAGTEMVRRHNTGAVLRSLRQQGPASRAELATRTGLAKATVGTIVSTLVESRAVSEDAQPARDGARGRPSRPVALRGDRFAALGLEVNVDYVAAVALDLAGEVLAHETRPVAGQDPLDVLVALAEETATGLGRRRELVGAVVAVPGLVRGDDRTVAFAPNLEVAGDSVAARVEAVLPGTTVHVTNDADCAAYAEAHRGGATDASSLLYLTGTVGIGAGLIEAGTLVRGGHGFAGEVGHMPVGDPEAACGCGRRGCWETAVGLHAVTDAVGVAELGTPLATAEAVAALAADDALVRKRLNLLGQDVGRGLAVLAAVLDPAVVVLGGYFVPLADLVLPAVRATLAERVVGPDHGPEVRISALGIEAAAVGAAERALAPVLAGDVELPA